MTPMRREEREKAELGGKEATGPENDNIIHEIQGK